MCYCLLFKIKFHVQQFTQFFDTGTVFLYIDIKVIEEQSNDVLFPLIAFR